MAVPNSCSPRWENWSSSMVVVRSILWILRRLLVGRRYWCRYGRTCRGSYLGFKEIKNAIWAILYKKRSAPFDKKIRTFYSKYTDLLIKRYGHFSYYFLIFSYFAVASMALSSAYGRNWILLPVILLAVKLASVSVPVPDSDTWKETKSPSLKSSSLRNVLWGVCLDRWGLRVYQSLIR